MFALAPLLLLAGLAWFPFLPIAEKQVDIAFENEETIVRGRIDLLILHQQLWVAVVESKRQRFNVTEARQTH